MIHNKKIGNSRFIFFKLQNQFNQWTRALGKIDNFIRGVSGFERANPFAYIFFLPGENYWVGREVIGTLPIKGENDPYILDFQRGEVTCFSPELKLDWHLQDLLNLKEKVCQENVGMIDDSFPWRICLNLEKADQISLEIQIFGANYPFPKLTN